MPTAESAAVKIFEYLIFQLTNAREEYEKNSEIVNSYQTDEQIHNRYTWEDRLRDDAGFNNEEIHLDYHNVIIF